MHGCDQVPAVTRSDWPTVAVPLIAGAMVAWRAPPAVTVTALLTVDASWKPALLPVARTEISLPRSVTLTA